MGAVVEAIDVRRSIYPVSLIHGVPGARYSAVLLLRKSYMTAVTKGEVRRDVDTGTDRDALLYDFSIDSTTLGSNHTKYLDELIIFLEAPGRPPMTVSMDGFASRTGTAAHNQTLSENREQAVENYLRTHTTVFNPGNPHTLNRKFNGFTGSPPGEDPLFRSVRVVVHKPAVVPPPITVVPAPTTATVGKFEIDLVGWIPQPEVDNPLSLLPGAITSLLPPGMADPFFGGDNFITPATAPSGMLPPSHTFRATQHIEFTISTWGAPATASLVTTTPGTTTCLNNRRAAGGTVTFSLGAKLLRSTAKVTFSPTHDWYEVELSGVVLDPVPAAAAAALGSKLPGVPLAFRGPLAAAIAQIATKATPSLTWDATLRIQHGSKLGAFATATYAPFVGSEDSRSLLGASSVLGAGSNLVHGKIHFSKWPSAVIFIAFTAPGAPLSRQPIFFSNGMGMPRPETAFIEVPLLAKLRQLTW